MRVRRLLLVCSLPLACLATAIRRCDLWSTRGVLRFRIEHISTSSLRNRHSQIDVQANPRDPYSWVILVPRSQVSIISMVMVSKAVRVRMTRMATLLDGLGRHCCRCRGWGVVRDSTVVNDVRPLMRGTCGL